MLPPRQGGHQHDEGGLGQVEIGDEGVQHLESVPRIDKDISPPGALRHGPVLRRKALHRAAGGGAYADDPAPVLFRLVDDAGGFPGNHTELRMHLVVRNLLRLDRAEGAQPHMECNVANLYTHFPHLLQQLGGEMEPCGGCGGGAHHLGIYRLIPLLILELRLDVRRKGHTAQPLQNL